MWIVFSGRTRSVLRERGNGLNLIVLNGLSLFIVIVISSSQIANDITQIVSQGPVPRRTPRDMII